MEKNLYDILGIPKDASKADIKKAYKKLSLKWHPDKHVNDTAEKQKEAEEKFKEISEAYSILSNESKRAEYDNPHDTMWDSFNNFRNAYSNIHRQIKRGTNAVVDFKLTIEDLYNGGNKTLKYKRKVRCSHCGGKGGDVHICNKCHGTGTIEIRKSSGNMVSIWQSMCDECNGEGYIIDNKCSYCNGTGFEIQESEININIDLVNSDMHDGIYEFSNTGGNESRDINGPDGGLVIRFTKDFGNYSVENNNVLQHIYIPFYDMILGGNYKLTLPNNKIVNIKIPENRNDGDQLRLKGKGIGGGDFIVSLKTIYPELSENDKKLLMTIKENNKKAE